MGSSRGNGQKPEEVIRNDGQRRWASSCKTMGGDNIGCKSPLGEQHDRPKLCCYDSVNANRCMGGGSGGCGDGGGTHQGLTSHCLSCIRDIVLDGGLWRTTPSHSDTTTANIAHRLFWGWTKQQYNMFQIRKV